jgi:tetratricopeptide (TPR) repeat protein
MAEGKALAEDFQLTDAIKKYREALRYWDHPLIHYNLSRLLNALERPLEAYWSVERALRADPATLSDDPAQAQQIHAHLLKLRDQLRARLVEIQIASADPDVEVSVGNRAVATAPVRSELFLPGTHRLAAQAPRHWPLLQTIPLPSGTTVHLRLTSERAFTPWKPWALTSAGTAVALAGFGLYWHGRNQRDGLADQVEAKCQPSCAEDMLSAFDRDWRRARRLQHVGVGTLITGGSAALLGAGLVLWNQRRELRLIGNERPVSLLPIATPEMTGVVGTTTF